MVVSEHACDRQKNTRKESDRTGRKKSRCIKVKRILFTEVGKRNEKVERRSKNI